MFVFCSPSSDRQIIFVMLLVSFVFFVLCISLCSVGKRDWEEVRGEMVVFDRFPFEVSFLLVVEATTNNILFP